ncbi:MAG: OFA family MFS transporter [Bifidobacteriaceae bacterium]|jgi:OFA family oxalate/formate antiporter-like MFS transporter|nr:OFA family MFS transporter [Bifidobacteriaceae bacterium]
MSKQPVHRWAVLIAAMAVMLCTGTIYTFSVLSGPLSEVHHWNLPTLVLAYSVNSAIAPIPQILGGMWVDRGGAKWLVLIGGAGYGIGWILSGMSNSLVMFFISYGVITGLAQGFAYAGCLQNTIRLFPDRSGLASGLVTCANGAATVISAPIAAALVSSHGPGTAMVVLGSCFAVIGLGAFVFAQPAPVGYTPPGWTPPQRAGSPADGLNWRRMISTRAFWTIFFMFVCGAFSGLMIAGNASQIGQGMFALNAATAALFVSLYSASNATGRLILGLVSDRLGYAKSTIVIFVFVALSLTELILLKGQVVGFAIGIAGLGLCFGGVMAVFPPLVMSNFGAKHQGVNYGITFAAYSTSAIISPRIAASIGGSHDGDYSIAFLVAIGAAIVGIFLATTLVKSTPPIQRDAERLASETKNQGAVK